MFFRGPLYSLPYLGYLKKKMPIKNDVSWQWNDKECFSAPGGKGIQPQRTQDVTQGCISPWRR